MKTTLSLKIIAGSMLITSLAFSQGGSTGAGGGGRAVVLADGSIMLYDRVQGKRSEPGEEVMGKRVYLEKDFSEEFLKKLKLALKMMESYALLSPSSPNPFYQAVFSPKTEYRLVKKRPEFCLTDQSQTPVESIDWACRYGRFIFIIEDLLPKAKDLSEVVRLIIHENLHGTESYGGSPIAEDLIAEVTNGLEVALRLFEKQEKGERPTVGTERTWIQIGSERKEEKSEKEKLEALVVSLHENWIFGGNASDISGVSIAVNGGGLVKESKVESSAYVGIASVVSASTLENQVEIIDSKIRGSSLASNVKVEQSNLGDVMVGSGSRIIQSQLSTLQIGARVEVGATSLKCEQKEISLVKDDAQLQGFTLKARQVLIGNRTILNQFKTRSPLRTLVIGDRAEITDLDLEVVQPSAVESVTGLSNIILSDDAQLKGLGKTRVLMRSIERNTNIHAYIVGALTVSGTVLGIHLNSFALAISSLFGPSAVFALSKVLLHKRDYTLIFNDLRVDRTGQGAICKSGFNFFRDNFGLKAVFDSERELVRRCVTEKKAKKWWR